MTRHRFRLGALTCIAALLGSCDVATVERAPSSIALNRCNADSDCTGGGCVGGQCRSSGGTIQTVLLEVTPPADGTPIAGVQFLKSDVTLPNPDASLPVDLDPLSQIAGRVRSGSRSCELKFDNDMGGFYAVTSDASISAFVTFTPSTTALGLYSPRSVVKSTLVQGTYFGFSVNVPPGDYDIYVEPGSQADDSCAVPPALLRNQHIKSGGSLALIIQLPEPNSFDFHVAWPAADHALDGWYADMLDPVSGRVIGNRVPLVLHGKEYTANISYFPVIVGESPAGGAGELVRLSPPDNADVIAPTVLLARGALGLFDSDTGTLSNFSLPAHVTLQGQVAAPLRAVPSTVTLVATKITGMDPGILASFVRTLVVGSDGQFTVDVLPGTYLVSAVPSVQLSDSTAPGVDLDSKLAAVTQEWVIPSTPSLQAGKLLTLGTPLPINGSALDTAGAGVATALVQAVASPASLQSDVLHQLLPNTAQVCRGAPAESDLCKPAYVPRASDGVVGKDGAFALLADPGTFDVTVRPLASTGFGWLVFPSVGVGTTRFNIAGPNLGAQSIPLPVAYRGMVTRPGADIPQPLPDALIRAYVYLSKGQYVDDPSKADSVVQIAETRADNTGSFEILIPASLNTAGQ